MNKSGIEYVEKYLCYVIGMIMFMFGSLIGMLLIELSYNNKNEELEPSNATYEYRIIIEGGCSD